MHKQPPFPLKACNQLCRSAIVQGASQGRNVSAFWGVLRWEIWGKGQEVRSVSGDSVGIPMKDLSPRRPAIPVYPGLIDMVFTRIGYDTIEESVVMYPQKEGADARALVRPSPPRPACARAGAARLAG